MHPELTRGVLVHNLMALANQTKDEAVYKYAMLLANGQMEGMPVEEMLLSLIRTLAENRKRTIEQMIRQAQRLIDPPVVVLDKDALQSVDLRDGSIQVMGRLYSPYTRGEWLDRAPVVELFHSLIRRLTRRLRSWYKGR